MSSQNNFNFPYFSPPPPFHPFQPPPPSAVPPPSHPSPPPPHKPSTPPPHPPVHPPPHPPIRPPPLPPVLPPPLPPAPSPSHHPTVIVIVFVSVGGVFFLAFLAAALFCFLKKRKKKSVQETELIHFDEHKKIQEAIVEGPHGTQTVVLSIEDDINIDEIIKKNEKVEEGLLANSAEVNASTSVPSGPKQHHLEHKG